MDLPLRWDEQSSKQAIKSDSLIETYDQLVLPATAAIDEAEFIRRIQATDDVNRERVINAIGATLDLSPHHSTGLLTKAASTATQPSILLRALWQCFQLVQSDASRVLEAFAANTKQIWSSYESAAAGLILLEGASKYSANDVAKLLPDTWQADSVTQALLSPLYCFARYRCDMELGRARVDDIAKNAQLDDEWAQENELLRHLSRLSLWLLEFVRKQGAISFPSFTRIGYRKLGSDLFIPTLADWAKTISFNEMTAEEGVDLSEMVASISNGVCGFMADNEFDELRKNTAFQIEREVIQVLSRALSVLPDHQIRVEELREGWPRLFAVAEILSIGRPSDELVDYAFKECERTASFADLNLTRERSRCLTELMRIAPDRVPNGAMQPGMYGLFGPDKDEARVAVAKIEYSEENTVPTIEYQLRTKDALLLARNWSEFATSWQTHAISSCYSRMAIPQRLGRSETEFLVDGMIEAMKSLPSSAARDEHLNLYSAIRVTLFGGTPNSVSVREDNHALIDSHRLAANLLANPGLDVDQMNGLVRDSVGWVETHNLKWNDDGTISQGSGTGMYLMMFFPAVRLSLLAVSQHLRLGDVGYDWMRQRCDSELLAKKWTVHGPPKGDRLQTAIAELQESVSIAPSQDATLAALGELLLNCRRSEEAAQLFDRAIDLKSCPRERRACTFYQRGRAYAALSNEQLCRESLETARELGCTHVRGATQDDILKPLRNAGWLAALIKSVSTTEEHDV